MKTSIIWPLSLDFLAQSVLTVQFSLATYGRRGVLTAPPMSSTIPTPELPPLPPNALLRCHHSPPLQPHGVFSPSSPKSHPVLKLSSPDLNAFREALPDHSDCLIIYVSSTSLIDLAGRLLRFLSSSFKKTTPRVPCTERTLLSPSSNGGGPRRAQRKIDPPSIRAPAWGAEELECGAELAQWTPCGRAENNLLSFCSL